MSGLFFKFSPSFHPAHGHIQTGRLHRVFSIILLGLLLWGGMVDSAYCEAPPLYTLKQMEELLPATRLKNAQAALADLERTLPPSAQPSLINAQKLRDAAQSAELIAEQALREIQFTTKDKSSPVPDEKYALAKAADVAVTKLEWYLTELKKPKPIDSEVVPTVKPHTLKQMEDLLPEKRLKKARTLYSKLEKALSDSDQESLAEAKTLLDAAEAAESEAMQALRVIQATTIDETAPVPEDKYLLAKNADKAVAALEEYLNALNQRKPQETKIDWGRTVALVIITLALSAVLVILLIMYFKSSDSRPARRGNDHSIPEWLDWFGINRLQEQVDSLSDRTVELFRENEYLKSSINAQAEKIESLRWSLQKSTTDPKIGDGGPVSRQNSADHKSAHIAGSPPIEEPKPLISKRHQEVIQNLIIELIDREHAEEVTGRDLCTHIQEALSHRYPKHELGICTTYDFNFNPVDKSWFYLLFTYPPQVSGKSLDGLLFVAPGVRTNKTLETYFTGASLKKGNIEKLTRPAIVKTDSKGTNIDIINQGEVE